MTRIRVRSETECRGEGQVKSEKLKVKSEQQERAQVHQSQEHKCTRKLNRKEKIIKTSMLICANQRREVGKWKLRKSDQQT